MRGLGSSRCTSRAARCAETFQIQCDDERFTLKVVEVDVCGIGYTRNVAAVYASALYLRKNTLFQAIAQGLDAFDCSIGESLKRNLGRFSQAHNAR